jgi:hypothetical protein
MRGDGPSCDLSRKRSRACAEIGRFAQMIEESEPVRFLARHDAPGVEQLGGASLPDDARQDGARSHVAPGEPHPHEQKCDPALRRAHPDIARHRDGGARARAHAVDGGNHDLRAFHHGDHQVAGHAREARETLAIHGDQGPDDFVHVAARAEIVSGAGHDHRANFRRRGKLAKCVPQFGVRIKRERILALGTVQRDRRHMIGEVPAEVPGREARRIHACASRGRPSTTI